MRKGFRNTIGRGFALLAASLVLLAGCSGGVQTPFIEGVFFGSTDVVGGGLAQVAVFVNPQGQPTRLGFRLTEAALTNLPATRQTAVLAVPPQANVTGFTHVVLVWEPQGHTPNGVYNTPHFDIQFFRLTETQRANITGIGPDRDIALRAPDAAEIPTDYTSSNEVVAMQGVRWFDQTGPEFNGQPFTSAFTYGFYDSNMVFVEMQLAKTLLDGRTNFSAAVKQPADYPGPGYYPTRYSVNYVAENNEFYLTIDDLVQRN